MLRMKCKHKHAIVRFKNAWYLIMIKWCPDCGALFDVEDGEWKYPKSAKKIERLEKEIKRLRKRFKDWDALGMEEYDKL